MTGATPPRVLYGGTFDPVHAGHLAVAEAAADLLHVDVYLVPSADPPLRTAPGASAEQRAAMLELAIEHHPRLHVDRRELGREGPSWTVDTLSEVRSEIGPETPLVWVLGADAFRHLHRWHDWRGIFALAHLLVAARPGHAMDRFEPELESAVATRWTDDPAWLSAAPAGLVLKLDLSPRREAASTVRARIASGLRWDADTPPAVVAYIRKYSLYGHP